MSIGRPTTAIEFFERVPLKRIKKNVLFLIAENKIPITNLPGGMGKSGAGMIRCYKYIPRNDTIILR